MIFGNIRRMDMAFTGFYDGRTFWGFIGSLGAIFWNFSKDALELGYRCLGNWRYLVMDDQGVPLSVGEEVGSSVESAVRKGMAQDTKLPSVKSQQVEVVYDFICFFKVNAINWKIQGRCTRKSKITPYESGKGKPGNMMSFDFKAANGKKD
ncbi:hypothetical protein OUZ56_029682 [Daphnia magna]|uniref:Uncharacterized protein n=1 Tax=Daphnia magna TaxID=35525 RepID=A0ABR0B7K1_9CRUS|nr:hypothetical protein OUZ56_029682 [Daphnia magna]